MNDLYRRQALPEFLAAANSIPGILIVAAISKKHRSLFQKGGLDMESEDLRGYSHWNRNVFEKLLRVTHI
ncbi:MAG: hypothetical protein LC667_20830, partial [Thioalkalivibrio sp.]|nr:hypothetical protein [Thioalkalivibrio sp.]